PRPAAFAVGVFAGTFVPTVFPWSPAGGVTPWPAMVQLADVIGERGVSALMALAAGFLAEALRMPDLRRRAVAGAWRGALPVLTLAHGAARLARVDAARADAPMVKIGLVQPSIEARERWDESRATGILERLTELTKSAERKGSMLTIWHEAAYPYPLPHG